jgi:hypothetical protein
MPHKVCSVCLHPDRPAIDIALKSGAASVRVVAGQFGLKKSAVQRDLHHDDEKDFSNPRENVGEAAHISREIAKLKRAQENAKRRRDVRGQIGFSRELRRWHELKVKAEAVAAATKPAELAEMDRGEALSTARALIESEVSQGAADTIAWLCELAASIPGINSAMPGQPATIGIADEHGTE